MPSITTSRVWLTHNYYTTPGPQAPSKLVRKVSPASPIPLWPKPTHGFIDPTIDLDLYYPTIHKAHCVWIMYSGKAKSVDLNQLNSTRRAVSGQVTKTTHEIEAPLTRVFLSPQLFPQGAYRSRLSYTRSPVVWGSIGRSLRSSSGRPGVETAVLTGNPGES